MAFQEQCKKNLLPDDLMDLITNCAREFDAGTLWLFGSSVTKGGGARDIDLAVEGLPPENFLKFYFHLMLALPKPVDLIDLTDGPSLEPIIRETGAIIYER